MIAKPIPCYMSPGASGHLPLNLPNNHGQIFANLSNQDSFRVLQNYWEKNPSKILFVVGFWKLEHLPVYICNHLPIVSTIARKTGCCEEYFQMIGENMVP